MKAERKMEITLTLSEEEVHLMITGLNYGTMHIKDHIKTERAPSLINEIHELEKTIRKAMSIFG